MVDHHNPAIKVLVHGQEIPGCIVDGGSGLNINNKATCNLLGITSWEVCPLWLRMADSRSLRPLGLLCKLTITVGGHMFKMLAILLALEAPRAYPLLLGQPWYSSANIVQQWQHNNISFCRGHAKIRVPTQESTLPTKSMTPLYLEEVHMLEGLEEEELEDYLEENPRTMPLSEFGVIKTA